MSSSPRSCQGDPNYHLFTVNIETKLIFQLTGGIGDERNPQVSPDGRYVAFDSNATPSATDQNPDVTTTVYNQGRVRSVNDLNAVPANAKTVGNTRNIFTCTTLGQNVRQFTLQYPNAPLTTVNSVQPTWSYANNANFFNDQGDTFYLGWSSNRIPQFDPADTTQSRPLSWIAGPPTASSIYYAIASRNRGGNLLFEADPTDLNNTDADGARRLDTGNDTLISGRLNDVTRPRYRDQYPTFAPFIKAFRMGFHSNRNGNYNTDGFGSGFSAPTSPTQNNLFIASTIDITAPTLIRYDTSTPNSDVVHINLVTNPTRTPINPGATARNRSDGITPGAALHFAVRVEDRGTGLRPENSADGGAVYLQFKNPNSRYQTLQQSGALVNDATRGEHKEFIESPYAWVAVVNNADYIWGLFPDGATQTYGVGQEFECQAISAAGAVNTNAADAAKGTPYYSHFFNTFGVSGRGGTLYISSRNDAFAFAGSSMPPLDGANGTQNVWLRLKPLVELNADGTEKKDANGNSIPVRPQDGKGGVLYGATWTIPTEASDWYIDVILYDNAVNPFNSTQRSNAIIYDNVWGFSSAPPIAGLATDILFVSDYTLGQKFFSSRFGTSPTDDLRVDNLPPIFWGAESYFTDTDLTRFPSERSPVPNAKGTGTTLPQWDKASPFQINLTTAPGGVFGFPGNNTALDPRFGYRTVGNSGTPNVLGVEAYGDELTDSGATLIEPRPNYYPGSNGGSYRLLPQNRYSIWRILSRGPVPTSLLQDYLPQTTTAPADVAKGETQQRTVLVSNRLVVWSSPFAGDNFVGAGAITDVQTQNNLTSFVQSGGRLFISGQDIGYALAGNGQANTFFNNILKAQFLSDTSALFTGLTGVNPTGGNGYVRQLVHDTFETDNPAVANSAYGFYNGNNPVHKYVAPDDGGPGANGQLRYNNNEGSANRVGDASFTAFSGLSSYVDRIRAVPDTTPAGLPAGTPPDAVDLWLFPGSPAPPAFPAPGTAPAASAVQAGIIASSFPAGTSPIGYDPPYDPAKPFVAAGKVVYASVGFETISQGWYNYSLTGGGSYWATLGRRTEVMHNITDWFRTGTITGRVIDNNGAPVNDALVRAIRNVADDTLPAVGTGLTDENGNFQIVGLQPGFYVIYGYKAGFYTQHNVGNSVRGGWRTATNLALKKAGPGSLSGIKGNNNTQGGVFQEDGVTPVPDIEITIVRRDSNGRLSQDTRRSATGTDGTGLPKGAYNFESILIGTYMVVANSTFYVDANGNWVAKPRNSDGSRTGVNERFLTDVVVGFPGPGDTINHWTLGPGTVVVDAPALPRPKGVVIGEGQNSQINFQLPAAPKRIKGRVIDQDSKAPIAGAIVTAVRKSDGTLVATGTTDDAGNYVLARPNPGQGEDATLIRGGTYTLTVTANGYSATTPPSEVVTQDIDTTTTDAIEITVPDFRLKKLPPGSLSGLVTRVVGSGQPTTSGVAGAVVTLYAVVVVDGTQVQAPNPSYTATVSEPPVTGADGYVANYFIASVLPGTYNAYVSKPGLSGSPAPFANITVTSGNETRNINFRLEPPKVYSDGIQLISVPQDFSGIPTPSIFGITSGGDNNGDGKTDAADQAIYDAFNVAEWTGSDYNINKNIPLRLGKGYFVKFPITVAVNALGTALTSNTFTIDLLNGWNLIGHPFSSQTNPSDPAAAINLASGDLVTFSYTAPTTNQQRVNVPLAAAVADGAVQNTAFSYPGSGSGGGYRQASVLTPWLGYWFRAYVPVQMTLKYPGAGSRAVKASRATGGKFVTITRAMLDQFTPRSIESKGTTDWRLQIAARQGDLTDTDNTVGVAPDAHDAFDNRYDNEKPPLAPNAPGLYLSLTGTNAAGRSVALADDIRSPGGRKSWTFTVTATQAGEVTVYWPNIGRLPRGVEPTLIDEATGKRTAMRGGSSSFRFTPSGRAEHKFRIEVSPAASMPLDILNLRSGGAGRAVGGYRFTFTTTRAADVNAEIRTLTGKAVRRINSRAAAGAEASLLWDGRDETGAALPTGPYVLKITVQDEEGAIATRSVTVMTLQ